MCIQDYELLSMSEFIHYNAHGPKTNLVLNKMTGEAVETPQTPSQLLVWTENNVLRRKWLWQNVDLSGADAIYESQTGTLFFSTQENGDPEQLFVTIGNDGEVFCVSQTGKIFIAQGVDTCIKFSVSSTRRSDSALDTE